MISLYVYSDTGIDFGQISSDANGKGLYYTSANPEDKKIDDEFKVV